MALPLLLVGCCSVGSVPPGIDVVRHSKLDVDWLAVVQQQGDVEDDGDGDPPPAPPCFQKSCLD